MAFERPEPVKKKNTTDKPEKKKRGQGSQEPKGEEVVSLPAPRLSIGFDDSVLFWDEWKTDKFDAAGNPKIEYKYSYQKGCRFLMNNGFGKHRLENNNYQFVRLQNNIVEVVNPRMMKEFMLSYLMQGVEKDENGKYNGEMDDLYLVREMFQKGSKTYCSEEKFESLDYLDLNFKTDTATTIHLYFKNCFVEVTATGYQHKTYRELDGMIWKRQIIDRDFTPVNEKELHRGEFLQFLELAVCDAQKKETDTEVIFEVNHDERSVQKITSTKTAIGYSISRHKNRAIAKALVLVDKKLRHGGNESNGGSGKGIFFNAISKVRHSLNIDGKTFRFDSNFPYTMINEDHEFVHFEDVKKGFDMEMLFNPITGGWEIRRLHENSYQIPFERSAKIGISTNFSLKGTGSSFWRRQHVIEFSNFFTEKYTPLDHFGHLLFDDWDAAQWDLFHGFMLHCIQLFLSTGLVEFPTENYNVNKLVDQAGEEFVDYMDEKFGFTMDESGNYSHNPTGQLYPFNQTLKRDEIFKAFKDHFPNTKRYSTMDRTNTFTGWVKEWCKQRQIEFVQSKSGSEYRWLFGRGNV